MKNSLDITYLFDYDANGQVMATYDITLSASENIATLDEQHIYGASRLGMKKPNILLYDNAPISYAPTEITQNTLGETYYEITNYLGNVNAVITDRKTYTSTGTSLYEAVVISTTDYYPFGMEMPGRSTNSGTYKFGYNSMEMDNEVSGNGNSYTTEFRQYDPRLGRWLSLDPLMHQFPWMSPYVAFDNNPIRFIDPYGLSSVEGGGNPSDYGVDPDAGSEHADGAQVAMPESNEMPQSNKIPSHGGDVFNLKLNTANPNTSNNNSQIKWGSQSGFYVHQFANKVAINGYTDPNGSKSGRYGDNAKKRVLVCGRLDAATVYADSDKFQTGEYAYRHAMSDGSGVRKAKIAADKFVRKQFKIARKYLKKGDIHNAYFQLGLALHTLQDATSPAHGGFQIWTGEESIFEEIEHVSQELTYPGFDSSLQEVTDWFLDLFENGGSLPSGNIFDNIKIDE